MPKARRLQTSFSKGELSPLLEGQPNLAAYFEGASQLQNWLLLRQGGVTRRPGLRYVADVKTDALDTIIIPFVVNTPQAYILEFGNSYFRVYKNKAPVPISAGSTTPIEIVSPYTTSQLRAIHYTESVDVMYLFHPSVPQQSLRRSSDTSWAISAITYTPPPSYVAPTDIGTGASAGVNATLTPGATTGSNVVFTASQAVFLTADVGRQITYGTASALITGFGASAGDSGSPNTHVRCTILDPFPNTNPIPAGSWFLTGSPQATLTPNLAGPVDGPITLTAGAAAFRLSDVNKYIKVYGGLVQITAYSAPTVVTGIILAYLTDAPSPIVASPAGSWTLEVESWGGVNGYPRTGEFFQGRLGQAATAAQPTTFWLSESDNYESYAEGSTADLAVEYTIASRNTDQLEWMGEGRNLFLGTSDAEFIAQGSTTTQAIGGDNVPNVERIDNQGAAPIQPLILGRTAVFLDASLKKLFAIMYDIYTDSYDPDELTALAEHIFGSGAALGQIAFAVRPVPTIYIVRQDGQLVTCTYYPKQKVVGFTRLVTQGNFMSVAVIPDSTAGNPDQVWVVVQRTIAGVVKRFVEVFEPLAAELIAAAWPWTQLNTDCGGVFTSGAATTTVTLPDHHLDGATVDFLADGSYRGTAVVANAQFTMQDPALVVEYGLHYDSDGATMRPAVEGRVIEGLPRAWDSLWLRLVNSKGGTVNGQMLLPPPDALNVQALYTGDLKVTTGGWSTDGRVSFSQTQPYPMTVLAIFGTLSVGDKD